MQEDTNGHQRRRYKHNAGMHSLYARITGGGRTRYLYAPELLTVFSSFQPPALTNAPDTASRVRIDVNDIPGQRIVFQNTTDFKMWQPVATNWLATIGGVTSTTLLD